MDNNTSAENNKQLLKNIGIVFAIVFVIVSYLYLTGYNFNQIDENTKQYTEKATDVVVEKVAEVVSKVTENYEDENSLMNMPTTLFNNITTSVSDVFSSISSMTFGGEPAKKSGKMMALKLAGEKDKDGKDVVIPKFLSSDDNGNLSLFDLDKHTTDFGFLAKSLTSTTSVTAPTLNITGDNLKIASDGNITSKANISCNNITSSAKVTGGQLCIGNTCIDEHQLKQLIRPEVSTEKKPTDYYNLPTNSSLIYEEQQNVATIGWSTVKTIIPHTRNHRIVQQAYKIGPNDTDVSKMFTRYSLSGKDGIATDATKNGWTAWKSELYLGSNNTWRLSTEKDEHLRIYRNGVTRLDSDIAFTVHNVPGAGAWSYDKQLKKSGDYTGLQAYGGAIYTDAGCTASSCSNINL
jgi:hypothetical protein